MKKAAKWIALSLGIMLAGGLVAKATLADSYGDSQRAHWRKGGWGYRNPIKLMEKKLDLKEDQVDKISDIMTQTRKKTVKLRADLRVARIELGELLTADEMDQAKVDEKIAQIGKGAERMISHWTGAYAQIRETLTPEQRKKMKPLVQGMLSGGRGRFGKMWGRSHKEL